MKEFTNGQSQENFLGLLFSKKGKVKGMEHKKMGRIMYGILFMASLIMCMTFSVSVQAADLQGDGTASNPYQITSAADLNAFRDIIADNNSACAKLMNDIALNDNAVMNSDGSLVSGEPDGYDKWSEMGEYNGTFDGNGYSIKGMYCYKTSKNSMAGLFSTIGQYGVVKNLGIIDSLCFISDKSDYGCGVIAVNNNGTIENCYTQAYVMGSYVGGIAVNNSGTIKKCYTYSNIRSVQKSSAGLNAAGGGIVAKNDGIVQDCYTKQSAQIYGDDGFYIGGLIGMNNGNGVLENGMQLGTITGKTSGQLVGNSQAGSVKNCYYDNSSKVEYVTGDRCFTSLDDSTRKIGDYVTIITQETFASGEITYLLNNGVTDGTQAWYQKIGTDSYPTLDSTDKGTRTVYTGGVQYCDGTTSSEGGYTNTSGSSGGTKQHKNLQLQKGTAATCTSTGTEDCYYCNACKKYYSDSEGKNQITGPGAIPKLAHSLSSIAKKEATCTEAGYEAYWKCATCNKLFSDAEGTKEIATSVAIPALKHDLGQNRPVFTWNLAEDGKSYTSVTAEFTCSRDNETSGKIPLDIDISNDGKATCKTEGTITYAVSVSYNDGPTFTDTRELKQYGSHVPDSNMKDNGNGTHSYHCTVCDEDIDAQPHYGGTATCKKKAVCEACGAEYGEYGSHKLIKVLRQEATCTQDGHEAYWKCNVCDKSFSDEAGTKEITAPVAIPALGHDYGSSTLTFEWTMNEDQTEYTQVKATFTCSRDHKTSEQTCTLEKKSRTEATCDTDGVVVYKATAKVGDNVYTEEKSIVLKKLGHKLTEHTKVDATCEQDGREAYWSCSTCGKLYSDANATNEIAAPVVIDKLGHDWGSKKPVFTWKLAADGVTYTATAKFTCSRDQEVSDAIVCTVTAKVEKETTCEVPGTTVYTASVTYNGSTYTDTKSVEVLKPHTYTDKPVANEDGTTHSLHCTECQKEIDGEPHYGGEATCTHKAVCVACGAEYGELGDHNLSRVEGKAATCTTDGFKTYWKCTVCNKMFSDSAASTEIHEPEVIAATGHAYNETPKFTWIAGEDGISYDKVTATFTCSACLEKKDEVCTVTMTETASTCTVKGKREYTASVQSDGIAYNDTKTITLPTIEHSYQDKPVPNADGTTHSLYCTECKEYISGEPHYGGTATCKQKAVCAACGAEYGELGDHQLVKVDGKEPTATEDGYKEYWTCSVCEAMFADEEGTKALNTLEIIPATGGSSGGEEEETDDDKKNVNPPQGGDAGQGNQPQSPGTTQEPQPQPAATGDSLNVAGGQITYKVINAAKQEVQYTSNKTTQKKVVVPDTVTVDGITYTVTSVADKAFANNKKIKSVTISKNITTIGKNAFSGCKNLKNIVIKSTKLKKIGKKAFKGIHKKAVIKVPKKQYAKYKKLFKKAGLSKTVRIKK